MQGNRHFPGAEEGRTFFYYLKKYRLFFIIALAVVMSGDYERHFDRDGIDYHHIIDPKAGKPARELASVTVIAATAAEADAFSTAIFVLGPSEGLALIEKMPGVEGVLVTPELKVFVSSGMEDIIEFQ